MNHRPIVLAFVVALAGAHGCSRRQESAPPAPPTQAPVTNRVDIPAPVRQNLGITFARVERRAVTHTLRFPGRFELLPTAKREYRTPLPGRVELLIAQYQRVDMGTPLYRVDSSAWRELAEQVAAAQARLDSMGPLRQSHRVHEQSLSDKVALWKDRLKQLEALREAGGGSAAQFTEARASLNATQAELADVMEKDAELQAQQKTLEAELRALIARRDTLNRTGVEQEGRFEIRATAPGVVESLGVTNGGLAEESALVVTVVQPDQLRFRARGLQADLGRLREGLATRVVPPQGWKDAGEMMQGALAIGLNADPDERTVELLTQPGKLATWARTGVAAFLEVTVEGGQEDLAVPLSAIARDGAKPILFRRDPGDADKVIRLEADVGIHDGRWIVINSGVKEGDEVVVDGSYQLMLASSATAAKGGHFHPDGTFHEGEDK